MSSADGSKENTYLDEVLEQQVKVDRELRRRSPGYGGAGGGGSADDEAGGGRRGRAIDYRITGFLWWQTVVVPPNVYVVHTRRDHPDPVTVGLGISFRFNPFTDSFLLIPAAMQTIVINARCICMERQGILVQAYVQWIIDDLDTAYRKLDFSDAEDPMRIVNVQLGEQAEAAIKDKVATMSIDQVLADKEPIIEELTHRLRVVAEGTRGEQASSGLGLKIVTVQIKEAVVSSTRLWQSLQKPFRAEREKLARLAELGAEQEIATRELADQQIRRKAAIEAQDELARQSAAFDSARFDREESEKARRHKIEQEAVQRKVLEESQTEVVRRQSALELALKEMELSDRRVEREVISVGERQALDAANAAQEQAREAARQELEELKSSAAALRVEREVVLARSRRTVENDVSEALTRRELVERLPQIAAALPHPTELRTVQISADAGGGAASGLLSFVAGALGLASQNLPAAGKKPTDGTPGA